ncbi:MAG TPA: hypothetical protein VM452_10605 [Caulifigura sp.]|jgi:hypothetical protein|nr:hypothetical protein [Caulifigura sp.]
MRLLRSRPLVSTALLAFVSWTIAGWWWGPVTSYSIPLGPDEGCRVLGLAEDGSLLSVERIPHTNDWSVWKRQFPDCGREEVWHTTGVRKEPPDDVSFRLQAGGRWLFVTKLGPHPGMLSDPIIDLRTGRVHDGHDDGMRWVTPEGRYLLTDDGRAGIRVDELTTGRLIGRLEDSWVNAMSPDGRWIAAESVGKLRIWEITDEAVRNTELTCEVAHAPSSRLGALNDADYQSTCQFTADSKRFVVFGERRLETYDLATGTRDVELWDHSPIAVSQDGSRAYERNGHVFEVATGNTLVDGAGWQNDITGVRAQPEGWFISQRSPQMTWWGQGWPGTQFRIGPYTIAISSDQSLQNVGCDLIHADTGRRVMLPTWFLPSRVTPGGYREEWALYTHPKRLALHNEESGLVRVVDMPPADTTAARLFTAFALFSLPGLWLWRARIR